VAEERPIVTVVDGCKKCGEKKHFIETSDGTPQPDPFLPLLNIKLTCTTCGNVSEMGDAYIEKYETDLGPDVVIEDVPVTTIARLPDEKDMVDLRKAFVPLRCAVCGKATVLSVCTECRMRRS
jgi:DNA-directed RNA polymerase subunit N (RpoN/RPB10)